MKNLFFFLLAGVMLFSCRKDLNRDQTQLFHPRSYSGIEPYTDSYDEAALNLDDSEDERINKAIIIAALALEDYICDETFQDALLNYLSNNNQEFMWLSDLMDIISESAAYDQRIAQINPFTNFSGFTDLADMEDNLEHTSIDYGIAIGVLLGSATNENPLFVTAVELDDIDSTYEDNVLGWLPGEAGNLNSPLYVNEEIAFSNSEGLVISLAVYPKNFNFSPRHDPIFHQSPSQDAEDNIFEEEGLWETPSLVLKHRYEKSGKSDVAFQGYGTDDFSSNKWDLYYSATQIAHGGMGLNYWPEYTRALSVDKNDINSYAYVGTHSSASHGDKKRPIDLTLKRVKPNYYSTTNYYYAIYERDWACPVHSILYFYDSNIDDYINIEGDMKFAHEWYIYGTFPLQSIENQTKPWVDEYSKIKIVWDDYVFGL